MSANLKSGDEFILYRDTASNFSTPTWDEVDIADESLGFPANKTPIPFKIRGKAQVRYKVGQDDPAITFGLFYDKTAAEHGLAFAAAAANKTPIHIALADGPIATSGTVYTHGWVYVTAFDLECNLDNGALYSVELRYQADHAATEDPAEVTVV